MDPLFGPTLAGVLSVAAGTQGVTAARGVLLIVAYCLGLGVPFILLALGTSAMARWLGCCAATPAGYRSPAASC